MAFTTLMFSFVTIQDGRFLNVIGNVTVQPVAATLPTVILMRSVFPVLVGEVPHEERVGIVPVAFQ